MKVPKSTVKTCRNVMLSSGAVVGAAYYFQQVGVWGTPEETSNLYDKFKTKLEPHTTKLKNRFRNEILGVKNTTEIGDSLKGRFNNGVKRSFDFVQTIPSHAENFGKSLMEICNEKGLEILRYSKSIVLSNLVASYKEEEGEIKKDLRDFKEGENKGEGPSTEADVVEIEENDEDKIEDNKQELILMSTCL